MDLGIALVGALIWTFALVYSQNYLLHNASWKPLHASSFGFRADGVEQSLARRIMAGIRLNLGPAGLRQKVLTRRPYDWNEIDIELELGDHGRVTLTSGTHEGFTGVRISHHPLFPSQFIQTRADESLVSAHPFPFQAPRGKMNLLLKRSSKQLEVLANGKLVASSEIPPAKGFLSLGIYDATVERVSVDEGAGLEELPFLNHQDWPRIFLVLFSLLGPLGVLSRRLGLVVIILGLLWTSYDFFYYSRKPLRFDSKTHHFVSLTEGLDFEGMRQRVFSHAYALSGAHLPTVEEEYGMGPHFRGFGAFQACDSVGCQSQGTLPFNRPLPDTPRRLLFIGGSLTGGWGTREVGTSYPAVVQRELGRRRGKDFQVVSVVAFVPEVNRLTPDDLVAFVEKLRPAHTVVEFTPHSLRVEFLQAILRLQKEGKTQVSVFRAPVDLPSMAPEDLAAARDTLAGKKSSYRFPDDDHLLPLFRGESITFFDANESFLRPQVFQSQELFLDHYHLTDAGHRELAHYLVEKLLRILPPSL